MSLLPFGGGGRAPSGLRVDEVKHPSRGGNPYGQDMREFVVALYEKEGLDHIKNDLNLAVLRRDKRFPCFATCKSWIMQYQQHGHVRPKKATGNKQTRREVNGVDLYNLALFRKCYPKAYIDEVRAYVHNRNPTNKPYSKSQIYRAEERLGLTRKAGSTTSTKAYLPINLQKRRQYWNEPYPLGIRGVCTSDVIDLDEARFTLTSQNRKRGKTATFHRCDSQGMYRKGEPGTNLLCAVGGDGATPISYHEQYSAGGTDLWRFYSYMLALLDHLHTRHPGRPFVFTMDNLNIHKHPAIRFLIYSRGHRLVFRAPYWSCDGPIEYVFNTVQLQLQSPEFHNRIDSVDALEDAIDVILGRMATLSFRNYFLDVGFEDN
ncbi:hypothetical protein THAOC_34243 [Thalassiosira oceanica]|uniref:Tc1-like transposase DDE domain-containing protein n=1 Tax=Thalassiosira oceanica TaxID=159749 RepID=K0RD96_THAOC|nr:hypothetical protein THAOC_34243 [Thalassiosira oceanica]|eukprot:EJK47066.1 hypothetical protein THAOC_34243 [Thalassiosira oceanica]